MSEKSILIQEYDENPCLSCTNDDCKYPCEAKQQWVLGAGHKGPEKITNAVRPLEKGATDILRPKTMD